MSDLISRQAAIDALVKAIRNDPCYDSNERINGLGVCDVRVIINDLPSAQPETHEERTETHACDLISRQAAIDALDVLCGEHRYRIPGKRETYSEYNEAWQDALDRAQGLIFNLPSAEQDWIPCSERLPEPRMAVLGYAPRYQNIYALYYDSVDGWMVWSPVRDDFFPNSQGEIVAWMPLPEPYREEGEE